MNIEIRNPDLQARLQRQLEKRGSSNFEEVLRWLLDNQEEQERWLAEQRDVINQKIERGMHQIERGEGMPEGEVRARLARLRSQPK